MGFLLRELASRCEFRIYREISCVLQCVRSLRSSLFILSSKSGHAIPPASSEPTLLMRLSYRASSFKGLKVDTFRSAF